MTTTKNEVNKTLEAISILNKLTWLFDEYKAIFPDTSDEDILMMVQTLNQIRHSDEPS